MKCGLPKQRLPSTAVDQSFEEKSDASSRDSGFGPSLNSQGSNHLVREISSGSTGSGTSFPSLGYVPEQSLVQTDGPTPDHSLQRSQSASIEMSVDTRTASSDMPPRPAYRQSSLASPIVHGAESSAAQPMAAQLPAMLEYFDSRSAADVETFVQQTKQLVKDLEDFPGANTVLNPEQVALAEEALRNSQTTPHEVLCQMLLDSLGFGDEEIDEKYQYPFDEEENSVLIEGIRNNLSLAELQLQATLLERIDDGEAVDVTERLSFTDPEENVVFIERDRELTQECLAPLQMAFQCQDDSCPNSQCQLGQQWIREILNSCNSEDILSATVKLHLDYILLHVSREECLENCTVPWCYFFNDVENFQSDLNCSDSRCGTDSQDSCHVTTKGPISSEEINMFDRFKNEFQSKASLGIDTENSEYSELADEGYASLPEEGRDFLILSRDGLTKTWTGVTAFAGGNFKISRWNIKKMARVSDLRGIEIKSMLSQLHGQQSSTQAVVRHLWFARSGAKITYATTHQGETLRRFLSHQFPGGCRGFSADQVLQFMGQIRDVLTFLQKRKILYLNWTDEHILVSTSGAHCEHLQLHLCNFDHSVLVQNSSHLEDAAIDALGTLCPRILPPEVLSYDSEPDLMFPQSDWWGAGCLGYHLATGRPLHWELKHEPYDVVADTLKTHYKLENQPFLNHIQDNKLLKILQNLTKLKPQQRSLDFR